jgi:hypothetical protein
MFAIVFQVFCMCFKRMFRMFHLSVCMLQLFHLDILKVNRMCCACCNVSHMPQLPAAAAGAPCMEGSGAADVEACGKQESVGEWRRWAPPVRVAGVGTSVGSDVRACAVVIYTETYILACPWQARESISHTHTTYARL